MRGNSQTLGTLRKGKEWGRTEPGGLCVGDVAKIFHTESQYFDSRCLSCLRGPLATPGLTPIHASYWLTF